MKETLPDLSAEARSLLEAGRAMEPLPPDVAARLMSKLGSTLATSVPGAPAASSPAASLLHVVPAAAAKASILVKLAGVSLGILGAGALATVAVVHLRPRPPSPAIAPQPQQVETPPVVAPSPAMLPPAPEKPPPAPAPMPSTRAAPAVSTHPPSKSALASHLPDVPDVDLAAERSLIARARSSLEAGLPLDALATLRVHEQRFEKGPLAQEREALRIQALIASGNRPEAEAAAARFERDYPSGLMGPAVRAALHTEP